MKKLHTFTLIFLSAAFLQSAHAQIVVNGSFEDGTPGINAPSALSEGIDSSTIPSWRVYNVASSFNFFVGFNVREDYANDGSGSQLVRIDVNNGLNGTAAPLGTYGFDQTNYVSVTPGTTYTIGFYAGSLGGDGALTLNLAGFTGPGGDIVANVANAGAYNGDGTVDLFSITNLASTVATAKQTATSFDGPYAGLQYYSTTWTPAAGTNSLDLDFVLDGGEVGIASVVLDNITVKAVPEPSTWVIVAASLGLLALLRLRISRA
jgi:hypothetical protein